MNPSLFFLLCAVAFLAAAAVFCFALDRPLYPAVPLCTALSAVFSVLSILARRL